VVLGYLAGNKSMLDVTGMVPTKIPKHLEITESITLKAYIVVFGFWNSQYVSTRGVRFGLLPFFWSVVAACCGLELPCPHTTRNRFYVFFGAYLQCVVDLRNRFLRGHRRGGNTRWESNGRLMGGLGDLEKPTPAPGLWTRKTQTSRAQQRRTQM